MGLRTPWPWVPSAMDRMLDARAGPVLEPLRAEVFGVARFEEHGRHLGSSHDAGKAPFGRTTFYPVSYTHLRAHET